MSIHTRGKAFEVRYYGADGSQHRKSFSPRRYGTLAQAKQAAKEFEVEQARSKRDGTWLDPLRGRMTVAEFYPTYLAAQSHLKPKTIAGYKDVARVRVLPRFGPVALVSISQSDVSCWIGSLADEGLSASTIRTHYRVLSRLLDEAIADNRLARNPARGVRLPVLASGDHRYLTPEQVERLALSCGKYGDVVRVLAYCGLRYGELAALRTRRVDVKRRRIAIAENVTEVSGELTWGTPKSYQSRSVPIPESLLTVFVGRMEGKGPEDLVFTAPLGGVLRNGTFRRLAWTNARKKGSEFDGLRIHDLRHTCASIAISAGASVKGLQRLLGHQSAAVTLDTYSGLFERDVDDVAERMDKVRTKALRGKIGRAHV